MALRSISAGIVLRSASGNWRRDTWISIEPYPTPNLVEQNINTLLDAVSFADKIIFGRTNYSKAVTAYTKHKAFYNEQAQVVIAFCEDHGIAYHIKEGTITE